MKTPLHYQTSEYDCGPTSMLNAVSFLFDREDIPPEIIRNIMLFCLDCHGPDGIIGKCGTSCSAMMFLSSWLDRFGQIGQMPISSAYLSGQDVHFRQNGMLRDSLCRGGVAVVRLEFGGWHYVLLTKIEGDSLWMFDPYYQMTAFADESIQIVIDRPFSHNRIVPIRHLEQEDQGVYAMGPAETREAVLLFNEKTKVTAEQTIEYII